MSKRTIELSIGSSYVSDWGLWEAIREIMQNAQDSIKSFDDLSVTYIEHLNNLTISNKSTKPLDISSLVLGNSVKENENAIGKYGEGYKLALLVLLRLGKEVIIYNHDEVWVPKIAYSDAYKSNVLMIDIDILNGNEETKQIEFIINGIGIEEMEEIKRKSLVAKEKIDKQEIDFVNTDYGRILTEPENKGKFYVHGLYVCKDTNFSNGYDFKSDVVNLDRDRKAINIYSLYKLTAHSLVSQEENKANYSIVYDSIVKNTDDTNYLNWYIQNEKDDFNTGFAKFYLEERKIDDIHKTFIGTEEETKLATDYPKKIVTNKVIAQIVNCGLDRYEEYSKIQEKAKQKSKEEYHYQNYKDSELFTLHNWIIRNKDILPVEELISIVEISRNIYVSDIDKIRDKVENDLMKKLELVYVEE